MMRMRKKNRGFSDFILEQRSFISYASMVKTRLRNCISECHFKPRPEMRLGATG